ncbi:MAG: hypothetical protein R2780_05675 [Crocinitomicaceae bacterium]
MSDELLDDETLVQNSTGVKIEKDKASYPFENTNVDELAAKVEQFLKGEGYVLETGTNKSGTYGKGNKTLRILFGAFVKRFTWKVEIEDAGTTTILHFIKDEKGYWGGAIGVAQVKNEFTRITNILKNFHAKHHN